MMPARGRLFVQAVDTEERLPGWLVILPLGVRERFAQNQRVVVSVGEGERCEDPDCLRHHVLKAAGGATHAVEVNVGDWVVLRPRCFQETVEAGVWCCQQDDVLAVLRTDVGAVDGSMVSVSE